MFLSLLANTSPHLYFLFYFLLQEKQKLQDEAEAMADRLMEETESRRKMADKLSHERHQNQKEKESTQEVRHVLFLFCLKYVAQKYKKLNTARSHHIKILHHLVFCH